MPRSVDNNRPVTPTTNSDPQRSADAARPATGPNTQAGSASTSGTTPPAPPPQKPEGEPKTGKEPSSSASSSLDLSSLSTTITSNTAPSLPELPVYDPVEQAKRDLTSGFDQLLQDAQNNVPGAQERVQQFLDQQRQLAQQVIPQPETPKEKESKKEKAERLAKAEEQNKEASRQYQLTKALTHRLGRAAGDLPEQSPLRKLLLAEYPKLKGTEARLGQALERQDLNRSTGTKEQYAKLVQAKQTGTLTPTEQKKLAQLEKQFGSFVIKQEGRFVKADGKFVDPTKSQKSAGPRLRSDTAGATAGKPDSKKTDLPKLAELKLTKTSEVAESGEEIAERETVEPATPHKIKAAEEAVTAFVPENVRAENKKRKEEKDGIFKKIQFALGKAESEFSALSESTGAEALLAGGRAVYEEVKGQIRREFSQAFEDLMQGGATVSGLVSIKQAIRQAMDADSRASEIYAATPENPEAYAATQDKFASVFKERKTFRSDLDPGSAIHGYVTKWEERKKSEELFGSDMRLYEMGVA